MRPTLRGVAVAAIVVACFLMAQRYGARALNAVAGPALVALAVGAVQTWRADAPTVTREELPAGYPDETRQVELRVDGSGFATVRDRIPDGVVAATDAVQVTLPATVQYRVGLRDRGEWTFGPVTVTVGDFLGLFQRRVRVDATEEVLVYPALYDLREDGAFAQLLERTTTAERQVFDSVREYAPGDPLRDVHWKSSAKRGETGDLVVKTFAGETTEGSLTIAASASAGYGDEMAAAAASIALLALDAGLAVSVVCPGGRVRDGRGENQRRRILELLARTGDGRVDGRVWRDADVRVAASDAGTTLRIGGQEHAIGLENEPASAMTDGGRAR